MGSLIGRSTEAVVEEWLGRRSFLKRAMLTAGAIASVTVLPTGCGNYPEVGADLKVLSAKEFTILQAVAEAIVAPTRPGEPSVAQVRAIEHLDQNVLPKMPANILADFKSLLLTVEHAPLLFEAALSPFTELSDTDKASYLDGFMCSEFTLRKTMFQALKVVSVTAYYAMSESWPSVGYTGPFKWQLGDMSPRPLGISTLKGGNPSMANPGALRIPAGNAPVPVAIDPHDS